MLISRFEVFFHSAVSRFKSLGFINCWVCFYWCLCGWISICCKRRKKVNTRERHDFLILMWDLGYTLLNSLIISSSVLIYAACSLTLVWWLQGWPLKFTCCIFYLLFSYTMLGGGQTWPDFRWCCDYLTCFGNWLLLSQTNALIYILFELFLWILPAT